jgi:hypothetical protein
VREPEVLPPSRRFALTDGGRRSVARFLIAVGVSAVLCALLGRFAAPSLTGPTDIVGYATSENFNYELQFWVYRLIVYAFPLFTIVGYVLLAPFGPLRSRCPRPAKRTIDLVEHVASWGTLARILLARVGGCRGVQYPYLADGCTSRCRRCRLRCANRRRRRGVGAPAEGGYLEVHDVDVVVGEIQLPSGMTLRDYDLAMLSSAGGLGNVALTDQPGHPYHNISARWLGARARPTLRVGSCPQWYGYDASKPLYVVPSDGPSVTSVTLSAIRR